MQRVEKGETDSDQVSQQTQHLSALSDMGCVMSVYPKYTEVAKQCSFNYTQCFPLCPKFTRMTVYFWYTGPLRLCTRSARLKSGFVYQNVLGLGSRRPGCTRGAHVELTPHHLFFPHTVR